MFQHNCLKCKSQYKDTDPDPYYCDGCKTERMKWAKEFDRTHVPRPIAKSDLQLYDEAVERGGAMNFPKYRP